MTETTPRGLPAREGLDPIHTEANDSASSRVVRVRQLFARVFADDAQYVRGLAGADLSDIIEARDASGRTPLMIAAFQGCRDCMDALVLRDACLSAEDNDGRSAYQYMENFGEARREQEIRMSVRSAILQSSIEKARVENPSAVSVEPKKRPDIF